MFLIFECCGLARSNLDRAPGFIQAPSNYTFSISDKGWILLIGERVVKCDCGHEFCDYRENWKLQAKIFVRDTEEKMNEIYPKLMSPDPEWQVIREYYCPSCAT